MWKKIMVILALVLLFTSAIIFVETKGDDVNMFAEIYDRNGDHISNVIIKKWKITNRVFDFDTSSFEGVCDDDISEGMIFVFRNEIGEYQYSGFVKNVTIDGSKVMFKGDDLRRVFDTEVLLDFSQYDFQTQSEDYYSVYKVFLRVAGSLEESLFAFDVTIPADDNLTQFINNPSGSVLKVNAWKYLKPYLAWYNYYVVAKYDYVYGEIDFEFVKNTDVVDIKLDDFIFDKTTTESKINRTTALIKEADRQLTLHEFVYSSQELYDATPLALQHNFDFTFELDPAAMKPGDFSDSFEDYNFDYVMRVRAWEGDGSGEPDRIFYMQRISSYTARVQTVKINYYLGNDNQIYVGSIPSDKMILPMTTKIFEAEYFGDAQYAAIWELVNSRYVEYIVLTESDNIPIDIKTLTLYEMVTVYDAEGASKVLPVSEIEWTQNGYKVKLGFKKTLLTEIIKN